MDKKSTLKVNSNIILILALFGLLIILRLPSLFLPFEANSASSAYDARLMTQGEPLYGTHHPSHHMPGIYFTYYLIFRFIGESPFAIKLFLIPWLFLVVLMIYRLGYLLNGRKTAFLAGLIAVFLLCDPYLLGNTGGLEMFAQLPRMATVLLAVELINRRASPWKFIWVGLLGGICLLYKVNFIAPVLVAFGLVAADAFQHPTWGRRSRSIFFGGLFILLGIGVVCLSVVIYFFQNGLAERFFLVFSLGQQYVNPGNSPFTLKNMFTNYQYLIGIFIIARFVTSLFIPSLSAGFLMVWFILRQYRLKRLSWLPALAVWLWFWAGFFEIGVSGYLIPYYLQSLVPPLSLLVGWFLADLFEKIRPVEERWGLTRKFPVVSIFLLVIFFFSLPINQAYWLDYAQYVQKKIDYSEFVSRTPITGKGDRSSIALANYLTAHTSPEDRIYIWADNSSAYYLAQRLSPIETIFPSQIESLGPYQRIFAPTTKYIVVGQSTFIERPPWTEDELTSLYSLETSIAEFRLYRRK